MNIPEPKFYLKDRNSTNPTLIYLQAKFKFNGEQRVMLTTGDKILPTEWDFEKYRAITNKRSLSNQDLNTWLDTISTAFKSVFRNFLIDKTVPTAGMVKEKLEIELNLKQTSIVQSLTFYQFMEDFIKQSHASKMPNTIKSYWSTYRKVVAYGIYLRQKFDFKDITVDWRSGFLKYLQSFNVNRNTEGKHIKNIKYFLNEATERGVNNNLAFKSRSFTKPMEEVNKPYLSVDEIKEISNLELSNDVNLDIVRDYFIISCFTALRYSDVIDIQKHYIKNGYLEKFTKKTGKAVIVPLRPEVISILEKYKYALPPAPTNQHFNRSLKVIGKKAGLNTPFTITRTKGGIKTSKTYEKWQLLTSHVGRRSLITNCVKEQMNTNAIMLLSGHKSPKVFQSYVQINEMENARVLSEHAFFKGVSKLKAV